SRTSMPSQVTSPGRWRDFAMYLPPRRRIAVLFRGQGARLGSCRGGGDRILPLGRPQLMLPGHNNDGGEHHNRARQQDLPKDRDADRWDGCLLPANVLSGYGSEVTSAGAGWTTKRIAGLCRVACKMLPT